MKKKSFWLSFIALVFLASGSLGAVEVPCAYDSNEEWPQPEGKVCQSADIPLFADDATTAHAARQRPTCSSADYDSDGDGWGWENGASCKVAIVAGHPVCKKTYTDRDGDGWGWENGASCRMAVVISKDTRVCKFSASDSDGDGWGWENDASCKVAATSTSSVANTNHPACEYRASDDNADGWGYEKEKSCRITAASKYPVCFNGVKDTDGDGWGFQNNQICEYVAQKEFKGVVFEQDFETAPVGSYGSRQLNIDWQTPFWHLGFAQGRVNIVADSDRGRALRVTYPANKYGATGAAAFLSDVGFGVTLPKSYEELYLAYDMKFSKGFDFVRGGKLPGLCGYDNTLSPTSGCNTGGGFPDGFDGWSARGMWREGGRLENYVYHADQSNFYGDDEFWGVRARAGTWHRVQHRVVLNTPGVADGILEAWLDGKKVFSDNRFMFRKTANIGINLFYFSTFYGGNDSSWAPSSDQYAYFDNFRIATDAEESGNGKSLLFNDELSDAETSDSGGGGATLLTVLLLLLAGLGRRVLGRC